MLITALVAFGILGGSALSPSSERPLAQETDQSSLVKNATLRFGKLSAAENELLGECPEGKTIDRSSNSESNDDPANAAKWGADRVVRADCMNWLCTNQVASTCVGHNGISLKGVRIDGDFNLRYAKVPFPLSFEKCAFMKVVDIRNANIVALSFDGCRTSGMLAGGVQVRVKMSLEHGFKSFGEIDLSNARIGGDLSLTDGELTNEGKTALRADMLQVDGTIEMNGTFKANGELRMPGATIGGQLQFKGSRLVNKGKRALNANAVHVTHGMFMHEGFLAEGEIYLPDATIGASLLCSGAKIKNPGGSALHADRINVRNNILLDDGFSAEGEVRMPLAKIGLSLDCESATFSNAGGTAFRGEEMTIGSNCWLHKGFKAEGLVRLTSTTIARDFSCNDGQLRNPGALALTAHGLRVGGTASLSNGFLAIGGVNLVGSQFDGDLDCSGSSFHNEPDSALSADGVIVKGSVKLSYASGDDGQRKDFVAEGPVSLADSVINENLICKGARFHTRNGIALSLERIQVRGSAVLGDGFEAGGELTLSNAIITADLDCRGGRFFKFLGPSSTAAKPAAGFVALRADRVRVDGNVLFGALDRDQPSQNPFKAEGEVIFSSATVGGSLDCRGGHFLGNPRSIRADGLIVKQDLFLNDRFMAAGDITLFDASVGRVFAWEEPTPPPDQPVTINFQFARFGILWDLNGNPPPVRQSPQKNLILDGLTYDQLYEGSPGEYSVMRLAETKTRHQWLGRQPQFHPQPYQQLADAFRKDGRDEEMRETLIVKEQERRRMLWWPDRLWSSMMRWTIGYGYRPWRAVVFGVLIVVTGWYLFGMGYRNNLIIPEKQSAYEAAEADSGETRVTDRVSLRYPKFSAFVYSVDVFTPVLDLFQRKYWVPDANGGKVIRVGPLHSPCGTLLRWYFWFQTIAGWTLTTLIIVGLTGLVHN
jgi:hypothetical protein